MNITSLYKALNYGTVTTLYKRRHAQTILNEIGRGGAGRVGAGGSGRVGAGQGGAGHEIKREDGL